MITANFRSGGAAAVRLSTGQFVAFASRSLQLLNAIENTVTSVASDTRVLRVIASDFEDVFGKYRELSKECELDPEHRGSEMLLRAAESTARIHSRAVAKRNAARADRRLTEDDGVGAAYDELIEAAADVHNMIEDCREFLEVCDALRSPRGEVAYSDAKSLLGAILAGK